jgi:ATPase subunit of ABC transporter with duplicated ATPase domains
MHLMECTTLAKDWAGTPVFSGLDFSVDPGEKIGIVGKNGSGKSTLVRILAGLDRDFSGRLAAAPGLRVALVPQYFEPEAGLSCAQLLCSGATRLATRLSGLESRMGELDGSRLAESLAEYGEIRAGYEELGGEEAPDRAARLLEKAGLSGHAGTEARLLSGGEKNILALAMALMTDPGLLVLDEPGNHLDFAGLAWLEEFIRGERRAVLVVSHNRYLLDRTVSRILELENGVARSWAGGYSAFRLEKLKRAAGQGRDWQADRKKIERLEALVQRFAVIAASRADPAWGKRLRARRSQLEREKAMATKRPDTESKRMVVEFSGEMSRADYALVVSGYTKAFGERRLFRDAGFDLYTGEKAAIVGSNGSGKTTLLRDIVETGNRWDGEIIKVGPSMRIGYCAQGQEVFDSGNTVGREFALLGAKDEETAKLLRRYLFEPSILGKRLGELSGGERNRLQLARAVWLKANFLILDEPTNHLDIESREAVEDALADFEGTILAVSHDRYFLEKIAERIILVGDGKLESYEGSFSEYWRDLGKRPKSGGGGIESRGRAISGGGRLSSGGGRLSSGGAPRHGSAKTRAEPEPAVRRSEELERRIAVLEAEKEVLEKESAEALGKRDFAVAGRKAEAAARTARAIDRLYEEWVAGR